MNNKAFTLIEMLVVLVVVGILIAMAVVGIQAVQTGSRESQRGNDVRNFQGLVEDYYSKFKQYPSPDPAQRQMKADYSLTLANGSGADDITYVCLLPVGLTNGQFNGVTCDSGTVEGGNIYRIYKFGMPARIIFSMAFASTYASTAGAHCTTNNTPPSFSTWYLYYSADNNTRTQAYRLGRCSEYGLANPSGSKLD